MAKKRHTTPYDANDYVTQGQPPIIVLSALMLLLAILTNVISNNAGAVIGTPVAIGIAAKLGLP